MIENQLIEKYGEYLDQLDISETNTSIRLSMIKVKPEYRYKKNNLNDNLKIGTKVMSDLVRYADANLKIITLTPDNIDGVNVNILTQFYKKFGFKMNKGYNKNYAYRDTMIRYPKTPGVKENFKSIIKTILKESQKQKKLLPEVDNRQKIIKFTGSEDIANFAHGISNKFSVWIANQIMKHKLFSKEYLNLVTLNEIKTEFKKIVDLFNTKNRPSIDLKNLDITEANELKNTYRYISDWVNNPDVPYQDLTKLTWDEAEEKAREWHESLKTGEVANILDDDSEILHKFNDGYMWVLTKSSYCSASQKSMGHCGSASSGSMYLLRLIKGNEEFVTMDWDPILKQIIQIKGKQNTKPIPKYYPYIVYILEQPSIVEDLKMHEGYKPENNLQLEDLTIEQGKQILENNYYLYNNERDISELLYYSKEPYPLILMLGERMDMVIDDNQVVTHIFTETNHPKKMLEALNSTIGFTLDDFIEIFQYHDFDIKNYINNSANKPEMTDIFSKVNITKESIKTIKMSKIFIKQLLREGLMTKDKEDVLDVSDFVNFTKDLLGIDDDVTVELAFKKTPDLRTTAYYHNSNRKVKVYVKDRAKIDVMRSIAHELVHHKQNMDGKLTDPEIDGADGSPIENEANAIAGIIMRKWGRLHPEDYV